VLPMNPIAMTNTLVGVLQAICTLVNTYQHLEEEYADVYNTLLTLERQLVLLRNAARLHGDIIVTNALATTGRVLDEVHATVNLAVKGGRWRRLWRSVVKEVDGLNRRLVQVSTRVDRIMAIKNNLDNESRADAAKVLRGFQEDTALHFWEHNFGSQHMQRSCAVFMQSLEHSTQRLVTAERAVMEALLDPDGDRMITVYEYMRWLAHFGPIDVAVDTTLRSLCNPVNPEDPVHAWFGHDMLQATAEHIARSRPGNALVRYAKDDASAFEMCEALPNGELVVMVLRRVDSVFEMALQSTACSSTPSIKRLQTALALSDVPGKEVADGCARYGSLVWVVADFENSIAKLGASWSNLGVEWSWEVRPVQAASPGLKYLEAKSPAASQLASVPRSGYVSTRTGSPHRLRKGHSFGDFHQRTRVRQHHSCDTSPLDDPPSGRPISTSFPERAATSTCDDSIMHHDGMASIKPEETVAQRLHGGLSLRIDEFAPRQHDGIAAPGEDLRLGSRKIRDARRARVTPQQPPHGAVTSEIDVMPRSPHTPPSHYSADWLSFTPTIASRRGDASPAQSRASSSEPGEGALSPRSQTLVHQQAWADPVNHVYNSRPPRWTSARGRLLRAVSNHRRASAASVDSEKMALVLSTDPGVVAHVQEVLEEFGFTVNATVDMHEAFGWTTMHKHVLMVLDSNVTELAIRQLMTGSAPRPATILLVGSGSHSVYTHAGASAVLIKPASSDDIAEAVVQAGFQGTSAWP
jgi:hypothetical protein